jgi:drug/metabolite transporter (DMT)-like permease
MMYYGILVLMTFLGAYASLCLKKASSTNGVLLLLKDGNFYLGGGLYVLSALLNIYILRVLEYSVVLPLTSLTYVWTMLLSYAILGEKMTRKKVCGVVWILIGAVCISM